MKILVDGIEAEILEHPMWNSDQYFKQHHKDKLTEDFAVWWLDTYDYPVCYTDPDEYWVRCAFALMGWLAAKEKYENPDQR